MLARASLPPSSGIWTSSRTKLNSWGSSSNARTASVPLRDPPGQDPDALEPVRLDQVRCPGRLDGQRRRRIPLDGFALSEQQERADGEHGRGQNARERAQRQAGRSRAAQDEDRCGDSMARASSHAGILPRRGDES